MKKNIEEEIKNNKDVLESIKAREIVNEIMNFGVTEYQLVKIIKLLSLELQDRDLMVGICKIIDGEETSQESKIEI